jgi:NHL repeat
MRSVFSRGRGAAMAPDGVQAATPTGLGESRGRHSMSARRLTSATVACLCSLAILLALSGGVAQAEPPRLVSAGNFSAHTGKEGTAGVAVEGSGDLFLSNLVGGEPFGYGPSTVVKLDASGNLLSSPSPFGSAHYSGVAVSPTNGDVYVLGEEGGLLTPATPAMIFVYDPNTGALLSSFEVPVSRNLVGYFTDVQIAVDSAGDVYVPVVPENKVLEYSPSGKLEKTFTDAGALKEPTGVAIDSSGDLWVADSGNNRIVELDSSDAPVEVHGKPVEIESEGVWTVALDGHGDVLAVVENSADLCGELESPCVHLVEYGAEGRQLADVGAGTFGQVGIRSQHFFSMVAVNEASGRVYVTDGRKEKVWVFAIPVAPVVDREFTAEVGVSEAKLGALVNAGGAQTTYRFEYGPTSAYGSSTPFPEGSVGEGLESHAVWAAASGLAPGSTYHYRVVATNELGTAYGPDQTFTTLSAEQAACPNEQLRGGFSASLPDCRAYELVTPPPENSSQFDAREVFAFESMPAANGEALTLRTEEPRPGAPTGGESYVATRGAGGWAAEDIMPLESYDGVICQEFKVVYAYSEQLTKDVIETGAGSRASNRAYPENPESCNADGYQVVSGEPVGYQNIVVRDNATGAYQLANTPPPGVTPADAHFQAASADLSHVIFTETSPLAQGASYGVENLYEWDEGALRLVSVLPDGTPVTGSLAAKAPTRTSKQPPPEITTEYKDVVSSDGSHVLFTYGGALYDRIDGQRTVQVDEKQGGSGPSGGGSFKAATADGSKVFFFDESKLTAGSTAAAGEPDLYECELGEGASKCELTDLTVAKAGEHADVQSVFLPSRDSSHVYFVAQGVLAANKREYEYVDAAGNNHKVVEEAQRGHENLYLYQGGAITFIANELGLGSRASASPDGMWFGLPTSKSLTGYSAGHPVGEVFLYDAAAGQIVCASCNPSGEAPVSDGAGLEESARRPISDGGRVFFETVEALVPSDTNGGIDIYEYEDGHVYLISSGTSPSEVNLEGASESGDDVFFRSTQQLVPQDTRGGEYVIYDARVDGGFAEPSSPPPCTTADACREAPSPQPLIFGAPSSQTFSGPGNLAPSAPATVVKPRALTSAQKLNGALKACKKDRSKSKRAECEKTAHKKYGAANKSTAKRSSNDRRASR